MNKNKHNTPKYMCCSKISSKRKVCKSKFLYSKEATQKNLTFYVKKLEKKTKAKVSKCKEIIKIRTKVNEVKAGQATKIRWDIAPWVQFLNTTNNKNYKLKI